MSATVQSTLVVATKYNAGALLLRLATPQLSPVTGVPRSMLLIVQPPKSALVMTLFVQRIVGNSVSRMVTSCEHLLLLPLASKTVQCTVVLPTGNCAGASLLTVT